METRKLTSAEKQKIISMSENHTNREIAEATGINYHNVAYHAGRARKAAAPEVEEEEEVAQVTEGYTAEQYWQKIIDSKDAHIQSLEKVIESLCGNKASASCLSASRA